jgi:hypothetical protein
MELTLMQSCTLMRVHHNMHVHALLLQNLGLFWCLCAGGGQDLQHYCHANLSSVEERSLCRHSSGSKFGEVDGTHWQA